MDCISIKPSMLNGAVRVPPSKSIAHRAIICGGLSKGPTIIDNMDYSDDLNATISGMEALGCSIQKNRKSLSIDGKELLSNRSINCPTAIDCSESGTTLRMLLPLSISKENSVVFTGRGNLGSRPLKPYYEIFDTMGIEYAYENDKLNLNVRGCLKPGDIRIRGDISSQFISGLLTALPLLDGESKILVTTKLESKGYIDLTLDMLNKFGIYIEKSGDNEFIIKGNQAYKPQVITLEGDFSQAAFFLCAGALGSNIECEGLNINSLQGDRSVLDALKTMGCSIEVTGKYIKSYSKDTKGTVIDGSQIPDILPILAVVASLSCGTTRIINAGRLRAKECDRLRAMHDELSKLGADITELEDGLIINGRPYLEGGTVDSWNDHRVAMALAIASTRCKNKVIINRSSAVSKSYPGFWDDFRMLGGQIE